MRDLETAMTGDAPDLSEFSAMRMRVGQALLAKRQLIGRVSTHLISLVAVDEGSEVRGLQSRDQRYSQLASEIIRNWPPEAIQLDWSGYCSASSDLRAGILDAVASEKALLYPLLERQHSASQGV